METKISVRDLIEWLCQQVGQIGQPQWDLAGHGHYIPKPRHVGRCHLLHIEWKASGRRNHSVCVVWPSLDSLSATTFSRPGMCRALESLVSWYTRSRFSIVGHKVGSTSCLLLCLCMTLLGCCWLLQALSCLRKGPGTPLKPERLL